MPKKIVLMVCIILPILILTGFGNNEVELYHSKQKLIDLNKAIDIAKLGTSATETDNAGNEEEASDVPVIEIKNETILYNGTPYDEERFKGVINNKSDKECRLVDNYAEAHVYRLVENLLTEKGIKVKKESKY